MPSARSVALLSAAIVLAGCGSRSGLISSSPAAEGGSAGTVTGGAPSGGGSAGTATGGVGASGGGAGGSAGSGACGVLDLDGIAGVTGMQQTEEMDPDLVSSSEDGEQATLMFRWRELKQEPGFILNDKLGHLDFAAWGGWPDNLGQAWVAESYGSGASFALADAVGPEHAFLFHDDGTLVGPEGMYFSPSVKPKGSSKRVALNSPGQRALFAERGVINHLLGFERAAPGHFGLSFGRFQADAFTADQGSGCATSPLSASAVRVLNAYLFAFTTSRAFSTCLDDQGVDGPPTRIQVVRWDEWNAPVLVQEIDVGVPVLQVALATVLDRNWLLWQVEGGVTYAGIEARPMDDAGNTLGGDVSLVGSGVTGGPFAAAGLAARLALAYAISEGPTAQVQLDVFDANGSPTTGVGLGLPSPPPYTLLGSSSGDRILLGWASADPGTGEQRVQVARFRCGSL